MAGSINYRPGESLNIFSAGVAQHLGDVEKARQRVHSGLATPKGFADGGLVDGPGTSTSDSTLIRASRGEFIIPARSVSSHGLETVQRFAEGGLVGSPAVSGGASQSGGGGFGAGATQLVGALSTFGQAAATLGSAFSTFGINANVLAKALEKMPSSLSIQHGKQDLSVVLNGGEVFAGLIPAIKEMVVSQIELALKKFVQNRMPELP